MSERIFNIPLNPFLLKMYYGIHFVIYRQHKEYNFNNRRYFIAETVEDDIVVSRNIKWVQDGLPVDVQFPGIIDIEEVLEYCNVEKICFADN
jgi:hypothetical protein